MDVPPFHARDTTGRRCLGGRRHCDRPTPWDRSTAFSRDIWRIRGPDAAGKRRRRYSAAVQRRSHAAGAVWCSACRCPRRALFCGLQKSSGKVWHEAVLLALRNLLANHSLQCMRHGGHANEYERRPQPFAPSSFPFPTTALRNASSLSMCSSSSRWHFRRDSRVKSRHSPLSCSVSDH